MAKVALLIGVSDYQTGFQPLPAATKDVEAVQKVLQHSQIGSFAATDIITLLNPDPQQMREMLVTLFRERQKGDLLLLYFSGHGTTDDRGTFYLTCAQTRPDLLEATAIPADFVHQLMENSRCKQQIVVLDCCFSGAFARGMGVKGATVNLAAQLGGQGRAVLTSSSATEYSFEQKEADLSVYTRYWVEGLETGAADADSDGWISVDELHNYTCRKVRESAPAMQPRIYAAEEGYNIVLAKAPVGDPPLEYRKEVERLAQERKGRFSPILIAALEETRQRLALPVETAQAIQDEVLRPYQELQNKLQQYEQTVNSALQSPGGLSQTMRDDLSYLQQTLGLRDTDVISINSRIPRPIRRPQLIQEINNRIRRPQLIQESVRPQTNSVEARNKLKLSIVVGGAIALIIGGFATVPSLLSLNKESSPPVNPSSTPPTQPKSAEDFYINKESSPPVNPSSTPPIQPKSAEDFYNQGLKKKKKGDLKGALTDYTEAIQINRDWGNFNSGYHGLPTAYNNRGIVKSALGDEQGALEDYTEAIQLKPDYALAYNNRGIVNSDLGDNQAALKDYNQAIQINQNWGDIGLWAAYYNRGIAKRALGNNQEAIEDYNEAIRLKSDYADAYYNRGSVKRDSGDKQGAIKDYQEAVRLYQQQGNAEWRSNALNQIEKLQK
jgi:uncharacterized caspase-like protein